MSAARMTGEAEDSMKIDESKSTPLDKDVEKRYEGKGSDEVKKNISMKMERLKVRLVALALRTLPTGGKGSSSYGTKI